MPKNFTNTHILKNISQNPNQKNIIKEFQNNLVSTLHEIINILCDLFASCELFFIQIFVSFYLF